MTQRQYIYISEYIGDAKGKAVLLTTNKPYTVKKIAIMYIIDDDKYFIYKAGIDSVLPNYTALLNGEYDVMCKYNEYFEFRENKFWEFMNLIKDIKAGKEPQCQIESLS